MQQTLHISPERHPHFLPQTPIPQAATLKNSFSHSPRGFQAQDALSVGVGLCADEVELQGKKRTVEELEDLLRWSTHSR
ncbi:predicted protein [Pyrenophora tritici-repentis Pt-1C-BFP]|uniref:Uncharacterized protein n=1 Tax=Pyrenophora tritici-repentis (strain Pt-1C-BFP) TaxID=426418 RepID=B2WL70_PYRTR|nr:uncharacterized protein PTRG_10730 [Pyrenophora tritici-repentis Pt-1C-BFP]EDU43780.1 predicted protein [Pyrenophora tritici-repentis Pt-1C-BFP]